MIESVFVGYSARKVAPRPDFLAHAPIVDVCSVSDHFSESAPDWFERGAHNAAGYFDTEELAWSVVPEAERDAYTLFSYRAVCVRFDGEISEPWSPTDEWPGLSAIPDLSAYESIGYDIVNSSFGERFDCSPPSCNSIANEQAVNEHCLIDDLDVAFEFERLFAARAR